LSKRTSSTRKPAVSTDRNASRASVSTSKPVRPACRATTRCRTGSVGGRYAHRSSSSRWTTGCKLSTPHPRSSSACWCSTAQRWACAAPIVVCTSMVGRAITGGVVVAGSGSSQAGQRPVAHDTRDWQTGQRVVVVGMGLPAFVRLPRPRWEDRAWHAGRSRTAGINDTSR
jgi:hypothetical protein